MPPTTTQSAGQYRSTSPTISPNELERANSIITAIGGAFSHKVAGQENLFVSLMAALLSNGHILLEGVPGLAKTTAAVTIADAVNASFHRIQCTPDILPSDIIGTQVYNYSKGQFQTQLGPVHANFVLLDEINRASAKTQSAMLEAMQERQTSIAGQVHALPHPFIVLATQNPIEQEGTYELPEAQLDRFLLKEVLGYPSPAQELEMLSRIEQGVYEKSAKKQEVVKLEHVTFVQDLAKKVYVDATVKQYIVNIIAASRKPDAYISPELAKYVDYGASPRGSITLLQVSRALALMSGRDYVTPDDVKQLRHSVLRHRITLNFEAVADKVHPEAIIDAIFAAITTP